MKNTKKNGDYRIRVTDAMGNKSYVVRNGGRVLYYSAGETPLALSNISQNAAELRFALQDAIGVGQAAEALRTASRATKVEVI